MLYYVQPNDVYKIWPIVAPMLQKAIDKSQNDYLLDDYREEAELGSCQLFVWQVDEKILAACIVRISARPNRKVCTMPLIAGSCMKDWLKVEEHLVAWAKAQGCDCLEGYARDGWLRVLKNWKKAWITIRRDI